MQMAFFEGWWKISLCEGITQGWKLNFAAPFDAFLSATVSKQWGRGTLGDSNANTFPLRFLRRQCQMSDTNACLVFFRVRAGNWT